MSSFQINDIFDPETNKIHNLEECCVSYSYLISFFEVVFVSLQLNMQWQPLLDPISRALEEKDLDPHTVYVNFTIFFFSVGE